MESTVSKQSRENAGRGLTCDTVNMSVGALVPMPRLEAHGLQYHAFFLVGDAQASTQFFGSFVQVYLDLGFNRIRKEFQAVDKILCLF
jgi:hypothetical protein